MKLVPKKTRRAATNLTLDPELKKKAATYAQKQGDSLSTLIERLLAMELNGEIASNAEDAESAREVLARLSDSNQVPDWLCLETGIIRMGKDIRTYVKNWKISS